MQQQNENFNKIATWVEVGQIELAAEAYTNCCHMAVGLPSDENRN